MKMSPLMRVPPRDVREAHPPEGLSAEDQRKWKRMNLAKWRMQFNKYESVMRPDAARKLAGIMTRQKRGSAAPEFAHRSGRVDITRLSRVPAGYDRVFKRPGEPSPTKLRMVILLDMSGSMHGENMEHGLQMVRDLIEAAKRVQTVEVEVWGHTTADLWPGDELAPEASTAIQGDYLVIKELWCKGMNITDLHKAVNETFFWGNEDGWALDIVSQEAARTTREDERLFFVVVSDGAPVYTERQKALSHTASVVSSVRKRLKAGVISVAVGEGMREADQHAMYGKDYTVPYTSDISALAAGIAKAVGKALN